jgi:putative transposase
MKRFKSAGQVQRFLSIHDPIANLLHLPRHRLPASASRIARAQALATWAEVTGAGLAA